MLKIIFLSLLLFLPLVVNAETKLEIPCYNEMFDLMEEFVAASDGTMNIVIKFAQTEPSESKKVTDENAQTLPQSAEPKEVQISWMAPKDKYNGATATFTMFRENGQCKVKGF